MRQGSLAERREGLLDAIERDEEEVRLAMRDLGDAARSTFALRRSVRRSPLAWAAAAFLVGASIGAGRRSSPATGTGVC